MSCYESWVLKPSPNHIQHEVATTKFLCLTTHAGTAGRAVLTYLIMGGIGTLYDELLPIFCSEDLEHGGLGMTSGQIGQILMVCGCILTCDMYD